MTLVSCIYCTTVHLYLSENNENEDAVFGALDDSDSAVLSHVTNFRAVSFDRNLF